MFCRLLGNSELLMNSPCLFRQGSFQPAVKIVSPFCFSELQRLVSDVTVVYEP